MALVRGVVVFKIFSKGSRHSLTSLFAGEFSLQIFKIFLIVISIGNFADAGDSSSGSTLKGKLKALRANIREEQLRFEEVHDSLHSLDSSSDSDYQAECSSLCDPYRSSLCSQDVFRELHVDRSRWPDRKGVEYCVVLKEADPTFGKLKSFSSCYESFVRCGVVALEIDRRRKEDELDRIKVRISRLEEEKHLLDKESEDKAPCVDCQANGKDWGSVVSQAVRDLTPALGVSLAALNTSKAIRAWAENAKNESDRNQSLLKYCQATGAPCNIMPSSGDLGNLKADNGSAPGGVAGADAPSALAPPGVVIPGSSPAGGLPQGQGVGGSSSAYFGNLKGPGLNVAGFTSGSPMAGLNAALASLPVGGGNWFSPYFQGLQSSPPSQESESQDLHGYLAAQQGALSFLLQQGSQTGAFFNPYLQPKTQP